MEIIDMEAVRQRWLSYNRELVEKFAKDMHPAKNMLDKLMFYATDYLIDFESDLEEDPNNEDYGILTIDTVTSGYIDSFLGRWLIQNREDLSESDIREYARIFFDLFTWLKENKLYKERAAQYTKMIKRLEDPKKYVKRLKDYQKIQKEKDVDEEEYLEQLQEWEYEDL